MKIKIDISGGIQSHEIGVRDERDNCLALLDLKLVWSVGLPVKATGTFAADLGGAGDSFETTDVEVIDWISKDEVVIDVMREREKQRKKFGPQHDARHVNEELLRAAADLLNIIIKGVGADEWNIAYKEPRKRERIIIAAALLLAELERTKP